MAQFLPNELLQVNKSWSFNVIPILWNRPFHLLHYKKKYSHHIISTYYSCLKKQATYNYQSFLSHLAFFSFLASVQEWCTLNFHENDLQIAKEIILLLANFSPRLKTLDFVFEIECLYKLMPNLMNATVFNAMIFNLSRDSKVREWISSVKEILLKGDIIGLYDFSLILHACRKIKYLKVRLPYNGSEHYSSTLEKICQFIESQQNLESITIYKSEFHIKIGDALRNQKYSLRQIEFSETEIVSTNSLDWILHCDNLESLKFIDTRVSPWLFTSNQPNQITLKELRCLLIKDHFCIPSDFIINLIQSSNTKLQEIEFRCPNDIDQSWHLLILENISYHCTNLTKLGTTIGDEEFPALLVLLRNCRKLKILEIYGNGELLDVDDILPELGLSLSHNLRELIVVANWRFRHDGLLSFFENTKHIPLCKKIIINDCEH